MKIPPELRVDPSADPYGDPTEPYHKKSCASRCTNGGGAGCGELHECWRWCPDGALTYRQFQRRHPGVYLTDDHSPIEATV